MKSVGIDIGATGIKVAELESTPKSYIIRDFFIIPFPVEGSQDRRIFVLESLQKIAGHFDPLKTRFVVGLRQELVSSRRRTFPFVERMKILKGLPFELEDDIPFENDEAVYDFHTIRYIGKSSDILAVATPQEHIKEMLGLLGDAGIDPDIVSVDALGFANHFEDWDSAPPTTSAHDVELETAIAPLPTSLPTPLPLGDEEATVVGPTQSKQTATCLVDIGHTRSLILIFSHNRLIASRSILCGGEAAIDAIRKKYNLPLAEAHKIFTQTGFILTTRDGATQDQIFFSDVISNALRKLVDDLKLTLLEVQSELGVTFESIGITGGTSRLQNLAPYLTQSLAVKVNTVLPLELHPKVEIPLSTEVHCLSGVAVGLAIEGLKKLRSPAVNFRKGELAKESRSFKVFIERWKHTLVLGAVALVAFTLYASLRSSFATSLVDIADTRIRETARKAPFSLPKNQQSPAGLKKFVKLKQREFEDQKLLAQMKFINSPLDVLKELTSKIPGKARIKLDLRKFDLNEEIVTMEGELDKAEELNQLKSALESLAPGKLKTISPKFQPTPGRVAFAFELPVQRKPAGVQ